MTYFLTDANTPLDGEAIALDSISLSQHQIDQALQLSQTLSQTLSSAQLDSAQLDSAQLDSAQRDSAQRDPMQQWQIYLNALARAGFEQWLSDRAPELPISPESISPESIMAAATASRQAANVAQHCTLQVGAFKLYLLTTGSLSDSVVAIPEAAIDSPEGAAQIYVLVEVHEEQEQVLIKAVLRSDQLRQRQQLEGLTLESDGTYSLPMSWFETSATDLLLYLRCLEPTALPMGGVGVAQVVSAPVISAPAAAISNPPEAITPEAIAPEGKLLRIADAVSSAAAAHATSLVQGAINTGLWLQHQLDAIAQELTWVLLPPPAISAMRYHGITGRSAVEQFEQLVIKLERAGVVVPPTARGAYRELRWGKVELRLYAVAWAMPSVTPVPGTNTPGANTPEWSLLVILGTPAGDVPSGVTLQIRDADQMLVERTMQSSSTVGAIAQDIPQTYLYGRVIGSWDEQFWVTVDMANGAIVTFPPFRFDPQA